MTLESNVLARWPIVAADDYRLGDGRALHRGAGWYCWTLGPHWAGAAMLGSSPPGEMMRSLAPWRSVGCGF